MPTPAECAAAYSLARLKGCLQALDAFMAPHKKEVQTVKKHPRNWKKSLKDFTNIGIFNITLKDV